MKYVLITGASGDIGIEITRHILKETDFKVLAMYNKNPSRIDEIAGEYRDRIQKYKCDFNFDAEIEAAKEFIKDFRLDSAIFCAGMSEIKMINKTGIDDINKIINVNLKAPIALSSKVADIMVGEKSGNIIYISSMWGLDGASCESVYSATKAGIIAFSKALSRELGPSNIRVNTICPGFIDTKMNSNLSAEEREEFICQIPLMRAGMPSDIADLVIFLINKKAGYITGANIKVDGGYI
ncbi:SDR family oxidoreductase [uncultured Ezakiella sp.]|uniref:elongation factor P 5-aminopentanone reductase n=1 Tax=uncultured Ezakiella sp. TaxID=1637529 RepID=UPI0025E48B61|nr:SDR family oxidoreductase [uncultured Ezakiella sp.]